MKMKRFKLLQVVVLTLLGLVNAQWAKAQNVTISPQNGSMICAGVSGQGTSGGAFAMWRHDISLPGSLL